MINNSTVTDNSASSDGVGGGIVNLTFGGPGSLGTVTINHTQVNLNNQDNCFPTGSIAGCIG